MTVPVDFDADFYLRQYPDIRKAGLDPRQHFVQHGRAEGRLGVRPTLGLATGEVAFDPSKATVLVVSHEASLTGAPVLSINLVRGLQAHYNVVSLLLGAGPLMQEFRRASVLVAGPVQSRYSAEVVGAAIGELCERHDFRFALVNSIESAAALRPLALRGVATVLLVHEFASYTRPRSVFRNAFFWADEIVFSTRMTHRDALSQHPELATKHVQILPQGRCEVFGTQPARGREDELARVRNALHPPGASEAALVVIGLGFVQIRKGVDLFIDCAAKVRAQSDVPCRFVWIGKGFDPEHDLGYSVYLDDQIRRAGLEGVVHVMADTPEIEEVYKTAGLLLLTSRLDPLPNVAIDAMSHGLPLLCFDNTTGIADALRDHGLANDCVVPYLDTAAMAARVVALAKSPASRRDIGDKLRAVAEHAFALQDYVDELHAVALTACEKADAEREAADRIAASGVFRGDFASVSPQADELADVVRWQYLRPWNSGLRPRKPFPGFHPGIYAAAHPDTAPVDPLLAYLEAGSPPGPWRHEVITPDDRPGPLPVGLRVALHVHAYYPELLPEILARLDRNAAQPDLYISVADAAAKAQVEAMLRERPGTPAVDVVPNRGRDLGPLLTAFGARLLAGYDIVGHVHTKKTADVADPAMAESWRRFLLDNLLGGDIAMADRILARMAADPSIALVFPDDPHVLGWGSNLPEAEALADKLELSRPLPMQIVFPVGAMFWARSEVLRPLLDLGLDWSDYPTEPLPYDGSMLHALERLLPLVAEQRGGGRCVLTNVAGVTR